MQSKKDVVLSLAVRAAAAPLAFLASILLARLLGPGPFGVYLAVTSSTIVAANIAAWGVAPLLVREISSQLRNSHAAVKAVIKWAFKFTGLLSILVVLLLMLWLSSGMGSPSTGWVERLAAALLLPIIVVGMLAGGILGGFASILKSQAIGNIWKNALLSGGLAVFLAVGNLDVGKALWLLLFCSAIDALVGIQWARREIKRHCGSSRIAPIETVHHDRVHRSQWRKAAGHFLMISSAMTILSRLDIVIVNAAAGSMAAGIFGAAARMSQLAGIAGTVWIAWMQPRIARSLRNDDPDEFNGAFRSGLIGSVAMTSALIIFGWSLAPWIPSLLGPQFDAAIIPMRFLLIGYLIWSCALPYYAMLTMGGKQASVAKIYWCQLIGTVLITFPMARVFGATGASIAWAAGMILTGIATIGLGIRYHHQKWKAAPSYGQ